VQYVHCLITDIADNECNAHYGSKHGQPLATGQLTETRNKIKMYALVIIRDNGDVDFYIVASSSKFIYECIIHTVLTKTKLEPMKFVHRTSLIIRQNFTSTDKYIYVFTVYFLKKLKLSLHMQ